MGISLHLSTYDCFQLNAIQKANSFLLISLVYALRFTRCYWTDSFMRARFDMKVNSVVIISNCIIAIMDIEFDILEHNIIFAHDAIIISEGADDCFISE